MYKYQYEFTTAKPIFNMKDYKNEILNEIEKFNQVSQVARNYKKIDIDSIEIYNDKIKFILETKESFCNTLSLKPLHLLSKNLLEIDGLNEHAVNKRFLKPIKIESMQNEKDEDISNNEVLHKILDIYMSDAKKFDSLKKQIKEIITSM